MKRLFWAFAALLSFSLAHPAEAVNPRLKMRTNNFAPIGLHADGHSFSSLATANTVALTSAATSVTGGDSGAMADAPKYLLSLWFRCPVPMSAALASSSETCQSGDWVGGRQQNSDGHPNPSNTENQTPIDHTFDNGSGNAMTLRGFANPDANQIATHECGTTVFGAINDSNWHHLVEAFDGATGVASSTNVKWKAVYLDDVLISKGCTASAITTAFNVNWTMTTGFQIMDNYLGYFGNFELAEIYVDSSWSGNLDTGVSTPNTLPVATRRIFDDANHFPVSMGDNCKNANLLSSHTAQICFQASVSKVLNQGTLTNNFVASNVYTSSYGPGKIPAHTAYVVGSYGEAISGATTSATTLNTTITKVAGDLEISTLTILDASSSTNHNIQCDGSATQVLKRAASAATFQSSVVCKKTLATNGASDAQTFTWTGSTGLRAVTWRTTIIRGGTTIHDAQGADYPPSGSGTTTTMAVPALTTSAGDLVVDFIAAWNSAGGGQSLSTPVGENRMFGQGAQGNQVVSWQQTSVNGTLAARAVTPTQTDDATGYSLSITPN